MESKMICPKCGKKLEGAEKYAPAVVYHAECIYKAMEPIRTKTLEFRQGKKKQ
jgi:hypothetical protein